MAGPSALTLIPYCIRPVSPCAIASTHACSYIDLLFICSFVNGHLYTCDVLMMAEMYHHHDSDHHVVFSGLHTGCNCISLVLFLYNCLVFLYPPFLQCSTSLTHIALLTPLTCDFIHHTFHFLRRDSLVSTCLSVLTSLNQY